MEQVYIVTGAASENLKTLPVRKQYKFLTSEKLDELILRLIQNNLT